MSGGDVPSPEHEQLFVENYQQLLHWARYVCRGDAAAAEDLVQTAFIQFVRLRPPLDPTKNLLGYLYRLISNVRKNQLARASARKRGGMGEAVDLPLIEELVAGGFRDGGQARDMLLEIARFASERRQSSKTGAVLILRFFLGYFPKEISQVMTASIFAVNNLIMRGRNELKEFLKTPEPKKN